MMHGQKKHPIIEGHFSSGLCEDPYLIFFCYYLITYSLTHLVSYLLPYLPHGAESFLRS